MHKFNNQNVQMSLPSLTFLNHVGTLLFILLQSQSLVHCKYDPSRRVILKPTVRPEYFVDFPAPVSFYMEVSQGGYPLLGLKVEAIIERPKPALSSLSQLPLLLRDDGRLADNVHNDGVYSAKFVDYTKEGIGYNYKFIVHGQGWVLETDVNRTEESPYFVRMKSPVSRNIPGKAFNLNVPPGKQFDGKLDPFIPPMEITDLQVAGVSRRLGKILLRWTSVGANLDSPHGKVDKYKIKMGRDITNIYGEWPNATIFIMDDPRQIKLAGETQTFEISAENRDDKDVETFVFVVTAFNPGGYESKDHFPPVGCGYGNELDTFFIFVDSLSLTRDDQRSTESEVTVNATWSVKNMDLRELERQNLTQISFDVLVGKFPLAMHVGLSDFSFKFDYNVTDTNNSFYNRIHQLEFSEIITLPGPGVTPQAWFVGVKGVADTIRFNPILSPLQKLLIVRRTPTTTTTVTTIPSTEAPSTENPSTVDLTTEKPFSTQRPPPAVVVPWWVYLICAKVLLLLLISIYYRWKKGKETKVDLSPKQSFRKINETGV